MTRSHNDRINIGNEDYGYSVRVGATLPVNAVNLAYVHTPEVSPKRNLQITDTTDKIIENRIRSTVASEKMVFPGGDFLLRELTRPFYSSSKNVILTDEFSIPVSGQESPMPLYYKAEARGLFDGKGSMVAYYLGGYIEKALTTIMDYSQIDQARIDAGGTLLYAGNKIRITRADGSAIPSEYKYKIQLVKQSGVGIPADSYRIIIYTNFRGDGKESFLLRYECYNLDSTHTSDFVEVLNSYPFFSEVSKPALDLLALDPKADGQWKAALNLKQYAISETADRKWEVYAPSQVLIADNVTRPAQQFRYKIKGNLQTKMNASNPGSVKVGLLYINESIPNAEDLTLVLKKIYGDSYKPPYLDFENPHPAVGMGKTSDKYWSIDLTMPADYLNDYDLIVLSGFGSMDMSLYNDALRTYLQNGGRIWIDNAGTGAEVLSLNNFLTNISFSTTEEIGGIKVYGISDSQLDQHDEYSLERRVAERLYNLQKIDMQVGYPNVNPKIEFGSGEDNTLWNTIIAYQSNEPSVITRKIYDDGTLVVSNCGIFRSLANRTSEDIKMVINMFLAIAEEKHITTPWIKDYVHHRDNLFTEEYKIGEMDLYLDDRSDIDNTQMVAKKMINKSIRDALIPYMPSSYYKAKGKFKVEVEADKQVAVKNSDFEVGKLGATNIAFAATTPDAIEGWSTKSVSGTTQSFTHVTSLSERGARAVTVSSTDLVKAYWYTSEISEALFGTYRASVWVKTSDVVGDGAKLAVHRKDGTLIAESIAVLGTRDWTKIEVTFGTVTATQVELRLGFTGDSSGQVWFDFTELVSVGSVYMTPENDGDLPLYAYSVRPNGDIFDLTTQGFTNADITVCDPEVQFYAIIRSFVYKWDNDRIRYIREYGNFSRTLVKVSRSGGTMSIGQLTALVPDLKAGAGWADKNKVFFELTVEPVDGDTSDFVNVAFFNTNTGRYYFSEFGEDIIGFTELYNINAVKYITVQAWTEYYTIRATKRRYAIKPLGDERIYLEYPATIDDREAWFLRVHNGSFIKDALNFHEYDDLKSLVEGRRYGVHKYILPEYDKQLFKPGQPYRRVRKEIVEYINDTTVKVQHSPLYIQIGKARGELMVTVGTGNKIFKATKGDWLKIPAPKVYMDTAGNGFFIDYPGEYDIDYINGVVSLDQDATGDLKIDYDYSNIEIFKRTYANSKIDSEQLQTVDKKIFYSSNARKNWLLYPAPVVYRIPYGQGKKEDFIAPVNTYRIDYETGQIIFFEDVNDRVYADYTYSVDRPVSIRDYDIHSGLIYLSSSINFKDELYCNYYYEENFVDYHGYYDKEIGHFMHLDLNPSEGHYVTIPMVRTDPTDIKPIMKFDNVPTAKLMNKEVYVYLLPYSDSFGNVNNYAIRHCFSKAEWDKISKTKLGTAVLLGIIQLREHTKVTDATVLDTRTRGGGLKVSIPKDIMKKKDPLTASYWDMGPWEGQAYYSNGVVIIELPRSILQSKGGQFSESDVENVVRKYIAYGIYFIIEYV
jgi:hypothetical protein